MENADLATLRYRLQTSLSQERKSLRYLHVNTRRHPIVICRSEVSEEEVTKIILSLRKKGLVKDKSLNILRHSLTKKENISLFFNHVGALRGLVGELTGSDTNKQLLAGECLCLLTLGTHNQSLAIAKAAGVYLVTFLGGSNIPLAELSCLILGNVAGSSMKACQLLHEQGVLKTLLSLLTYNYEELRSTAMFSLGHFLATCPSLIEMDELSHAVELLSDFTEFDRHHARLLFVLSSNGSTLCPAFAKFKILTLIVNQIVLYVSDKEWDKEEATVLHLLRTLANLVNDDNVIADEGHMLLQDDFVQILRKLLVCQRQHFVSTLLWYFGNIENHSHLTVDWKMDYLNKFSDMLVLCI